MAGKSLEEIVGAQSIADFIVETGVSASGARWMRWRSGRLEHYGNESLSAGSTNVTFPVPFASSPTLLTTWVGEGTSANGIDLLTGTSFTASATDDAILCWRAIGQVVEE